MDFHILPLWPDAFQHIPTKPTYALRIFSTYSTASDKRPLQESPLYIHTAQYTFNDVDLTFGDQSLLMQSDLATKIIQEFAQYKDQCESMMIHCAQGKNRSPAVAMALNEIFNLGQDTTELKQRYKDYNKYIYHKLKETATELTFFSSSHP